MTQQKRRQAKGGVGGYMFFFLGVLSSTLIGFVAVYVLQAHQEHITVDPVAIASTELATTSEIRKLEVPEQKRPAPTPADLAASDQPTNSIPKDLLPRQVNDEQLKEMDSRSQQRPLEQPESAPAPNAAQTEVVVPPVAATAEAKQEPAHKSEEQPQEEGKLIPFRQWVDQLWPEAHARKVSRKTFDRLMGNIQPDFSLPDLAIPGKGQDNGGQAEFIKTPASYLDTGSLQRLASQGRTKAAEMRELLAAIEQKSGVSKYVVLAIWGREGGFGSYHFPHNAIRALSTQAYAGHRKAQFREELLIALSLVERGLVKSSDMNASWAGAMGQTQFMPSDYDKYAVSFDDSGKPDPWGSLPDALASAANQLRVNGWVNALPWGLEIRVDNKIDCTLATPDIALTLAEWAAKGIIPVEPEAAKSLPPEAKLNLLMPAGHYGPAILITDNFKALKAYNQSELYALFVADLAARIGGGKGGFKKPWSDIALLKTSEVEELQRQLTVKGFYKDKVDGFAGSRTRTAVGLYQKSRALKADCWPTRETLLHIRKSYN